MVTRPAVIFLRIGLFLSDWGKKIMIFITFVYFKEILIKVENWSGNKLKIFY